METWHDAKESIQPTLMVTSLVCANGKSDELFSAELERHTPPTLPGSKNTPKIRQHDYLGRQIS